MHYLISRHSTASQFIQIDLRLTVEKGEKLMLQLPAWRPGRYELANFAQKVKGFSVVCGQEKITWSKSTKDLWVLHATAAGEYRIRYEYCCNQMDAGGCWSDDRQLYLNFSNFSFDVAGRENESITVEIDFPDHFITATALPKVGSALWKAENFQHLIDSPWVGSATIQHFHFRIEHTTFHLWFNGEIHFDIERLASVFEAFSRRQIEDFGEFPASDYHFIFHLLPFTYYHGVEHAYSTVITFGPAVSLAEKIQLDELIGISSHELYHFWNVCRIRPKGILSYDLSRECYMDTGLVMEGVTTYFGDMYLLRAGYFTLEEYLQSLLSNIQRDFDGFGWRNQTIVDSSFDLWMDGYKSGVPDKKVSIYKRGALIAICLDLMLMDCGSSLAYAMKSMWVKFGKTNKGYSLDDFERVLMESSCESKELRDFLQNIVHGTEDLFPYLHRHLLSIAVVLHADSNPDRLEGAFGIKLGKDREVTQVHPDCPAYHLVMVKDVIQTILEVGEPQAEVPEKCGISMQILRWGKEITVTLPEENSRYFPVFRLEVIGKNEKQNKWAI